MAMSTKWSRKNLPVQIVASPRIRQPEYRSQLLGVVSAAHRRFFNEFMILGKRERTEK
jgi:hypothetical protein